MFAAWKDLFDIVKNALDSIKSLFLLTIVLVLLFYTDFLNGLFDKYKVSELKLGGIKIDRSQAIKLLNENADQIPKLKQQIEAASIQLKRSKETIH